MAKEGAMEREIIPGKPKSPNQKCVMVKKND